MSSSLTHAALIERIVPILLVATIILIGAVTLYPFLPALLWGTMVAIAIAPSFRWLVGRLNGRKTLAAWLTGLALTAAFVVPIIGLARALLAFLPDAFVWIERFAVNVPDNPPEAINNLPAIGPQISDLWHSLFTDASGVAARFGEELKAFMIWFLGVTEIAGLFVFEFIIGVLLAVLFVYRSERIEEIAVKFLDKVGGDFARRLAAHSVTTTRQAVLGVLGAALAQTLVATFSYIVAGVPGWIIWAGITFILSLVQIGPALIWLPMSIWLWGSGQPYMALFIFLWGLIVVNLTDNIVRPILVAKDSNLPAFFAFLGALGGMFVWGVVGVFVGPVIVAVGYEMIVKWIEPDTLPSEGLNKPRSLQEEPLGS